MQDQWQRTELYIYTEYIDYVYMCEIAFDLNVLKVAEDSCVEMYAREGDTVTTLLSVFKY